MTHDITGLQIHERIYVGSEYKISYKVTVQLPREFLSSIAIKC